jgi:hypothetical protein
MDTFSEQVSYAEEHCDRCLPEVLPGGGVAMVSTGDSSAQVVQEAGENGAITSQVWFINPLRISFS